MLHARPLQHRPHCLLIGILILLILTAVACNKNPAPSTAPVIPTPQASPTSVPQPTATNPPSPAPTVTISAPEIISSPTLPPCDLVYFFEPAPETCPAGAPVISAAAEQPFEGGVMIWFEETGSITVFFQDGRWQRFEDTWTEEQPANDPTIIPPDGRFQPIRGFGKIWREQPEIRDALGWALGVELGFESMAQDQAPVQGQPDQSFLLTYNGQIFALIQRAPDQGDWVIAADNR